jgi:hypothetical protein
MNVSVNGWETLGILVCLCLNVFTRQIQLREFVVGEVLVPKS